MSTAIHTNDTNFESDVLKSDVLTLVDFWAPWCAPCLMVAPVLEALVESYPERLRLVKVNVDESSRHAVQYGVQAIPNLIFFKDGEVVDQMIGVASKAALEQKIEGLLA